MMPWGGTGERVGGGEEWLGRDEFGIKRVDIYLLSSVWKRVGVLIKPSLTGGLIFTRKALSAQDENLSQPLSLDADSQFLGGLTNCNGQRRNIQHNDIIHQHYPKDLEHIL